MNEYIKTYNDGSKHYYKDKKKTILHREDGPAVEHANGGKEWYLNGKLHRMDGPAVEFVTDRKMWFINDVLIFDVDKSGKIIGRMK